MRVLLSHDPLLKPNEFYHEASPWPAKWISASLDPTRSSVFAYRRRFTLDAPLRCRLHVSADQRYDLFLDGQRIGRGPERGDRLNWFYESYELELAAGEHTLVARVWWLLDDAPTPYAQITVRPAFFAMGEAVDERLAHMLHELLSTGVAPWEFKELHGYEFVAPEARGSFLVTGARIHVRGDSFDWGFERGDGDGWQPIDAKRSSLAAVKSIVAETRPDRLLRPALLPAMLEELRHVGIARHVEAVAPDHPANAPVHAANHLTDEATAWNELLAGRAVFLFSPNAARRIILDLDDYYCGYPLLVVAGGGDARIEMRWAESLYEDPAKHVKGNRDAIEGKTFIGIGDTFFPDGGEHRLFETLWWEAGRYVQFTITTRDQPLVIESFALLETRYPHRFESKFESSDPRLAQVIKPALRTLEMCSHETYMDCPYYEQLMYVGDTRLQVLVTYATTRDDRLPRKAIEMFDLSRANSGGAGLTMARWPSKVLQTIPPFSLWWVAMLHDYLMWRGERDFIIARMPGVRAVLDAFRAKLTSDDLVLSPAGWNFVDWVPGWFHGMPPGAHVGPSGTINFHVVYTLRLAAELEDFAGEPELAARDRKLADRIAAASGDAFFDSARGLFAEDRGKTTFSEHTQCLALLGGGITAGRRPHVVEALTSDPNLARTTIYFTHYLFETYRALGRIDLLLDRMKLWFSLHDNGNRTTIEMPEPTRSDCHAWGAHPVYHYYATLLGIRPASPAFATARIDPQLGPLEWAKGTMVHPKGEIRVEARRGQKPDISVPSGVTLIP